jgi:ABC-type transport system involved in multi-copper enzyme maturation permease subunit
MSASSNKKEPVKPTGTDMSAVAGKDGQTMGVLALIFGVGGLLMSWILVGGVLGVFGIVLGIIAMVKALNAKKRKQAAGEPAVIGGAFGLGIVGIITGLVAVVVSMLLYTASEEAISKCDNLDRTSAEYADCISKNMGTDKPK